jgi:hypothetical protein
VYRFSVSKKRSTGSGLRALAIEAKHRRVANEHRYGSARRIYCRSRSISYLYSPEDYRPVIEVPDSTLRFGFGKNPGGTQSRRTIMLADLQALLSSCPADASAADYRAAVVEQNALLKPTAEARQTSFEVLAARYALDPGVLLFHVLR